MFSTLYQNKVTHMILDFLETITERMEPNFGKKTTQISAGIILAPCIFQILNLQLLAKTLCGLT